MDDPEYLGMREACQQPNLFLQYLRDDVASLRLVNLIGDLLVEDEDRSRLMKQRKQEKKTAVTNIESGDSQSTFYKSRFGDQTHYVSVGGMRRKVGSPSEKKPR